MTVVAGPGTHGLPSGTAARRTGLGSAHLCATLFACVVALPLHASDVAPAETAVRTTVERVLTVLADDALEPATRKRQVRALVGERFDFVAMSKRVLAANWNKASPEQRARFTHLFRELLTNTYWRKFERYAGEQVVHTGARLRSPTLATVDTVIETATADIPIAYMLYARDGEWLVYDVVIEQASLVRNYRGGFQDIVREQGMPGLIDHLEREVAASSDAAR